MKIALTMPTLTHPACFANAMQHVVRPPNQVLMLITQDLLDWERIHRALAVKREICLWRKRHRQG